MKLPFETVKREILIKKESKAEFGVSSEKRKTEDIIDYGIINIDKPRGPTSHQVCDYVKRILKIVNSHKG